MPQNNVQNQAKRPYLARSERRRQLLDAAAKIVEIEGWTQLNMSGLAKATGTSRQLIYQHFESLEELMTETGTHIFEQVYLLTRNAIENRDEDIANTLVRSQEIIFDLPMGRAQALWQVLASTFPADHPLTEYGKRLRHLITNLWKPAIMETTGLSEEDAAEIAWPLIMAFWGNFRLMQDGELSRKQAIDKINWLITTLAAGIKAQKSD